MIKFVIQLFQLKGGPVFKFVRLEPGFSVLVVPVYLVV